MLPNILPLNDFEHKEQELQARGLLSDPWLARKTDRHRRLREIREYIEKYCLDEFISDPEMIVDIGPGPGEFLEYARHCGNPIMGVDAPDGKGGMGDKYVQFSRLMHLRQKIPVSYQRFSLWLSSQDASKSPCRAKLINFRGSIEQCFSMFMEGPEHHLHQDCSKLSWRENDQTAKAMLWAFRTMKNLLVDGGAILIHANGAKNYEWFRLRMFELAGQLGMGIHVLSGDSRVVKISLTI